MKEFISKYWKPTVKTVAFLLIFVLLFSHIQNIFELKNSGSGYGKYDFYHEEEDNSIDTLVFGNSRINRAYDPVTVDEIAGSYSYNMGIPGLCAKHVYVKMQDSFKTQTPKLVIIETAIFDEAASDSLDEQYNYRTLMPMPTSLFKFRSAIMLAPSKGAILGLTLPLVRFHSRYKDVTVEDYVFMMDVNDDYDYSTKSSIETMHTHRGYTPYPSYKVVNDKYASVFTKDYSEITDIAVLADEPAEYLDKIVELCKSIDAKILFVSVPALSKKVNYSFSVPISNFLEARYADDPDIDVLDLYVNYRDVGLEYTHFHNTNHLNLSGAQLVSTYLGHYLADNYQF